MGPESRRRDLTAAALLWLAFGVGCVVPFRPDFDVTYGIESWRRFGLLPASIAAAIVFALVAGRPLHRVVAEAAAKATKRAPWVPILVIAATALFVVFPNVRLSSDGMESVRRVVDHDVKPSSPLTTWMQSVAYWCGADPVWSVRLASCAAGAAGVAFGVALARELFDDAPRRTSAAFLLLATGNAAVFFGAISIYAALGAAVLAYLWACVRVLRGRADERLPALTLGIAFALHGSAGLLLPSLFWLARGDSPHGRVRRFARSLGVFLAPVAATWAAMYFIAWGAKLPPAGHLRYGDFFGAMGLGPLLRLRLDHGDVGPPYGLLDLEHSVGVVTTLFLAAPAAWALLVADRISPADASGEKPEKRLVVFAVVALVPWIAYAIFWNVSYPLRRNWDLFSPAGTLVAFLACLLCVRRGAGAAVAVAATCAFAFAPFVATNAGDVRDRRGFAQAAVTVLAQPQAASNARIDAAARYWTAIAKDADATGASRLTEQGDALATQSRFEEAAAAYGAAIQAEPDDLNALYRRGLCLRELRRRADARRDLTAAMTATHEVFRSRVRIAMAQLALDEGDVPAAITQLERSLRECSWAADAPSTARSLAGLWRETGRADVADSIERWADAKTRAP